MPESIDTYINSIHSKLQVLLKMHATLEKENESLAKENDLFKSNEKVLLEKLNQQEMQLNILKASSGKLEGNEKSAFEKTINKYIRSIDKCIGLLNK
ncbi:MAG TPA: hypothetical protein VN726_21655 [Hanamia sp.]|jgi:hypothetical protein|nr:hypothetical protein [Hanamia sp.]